MWKNALLAALAAIAFAPAAGAVAVDASCTLVVSGGASSAACAAETDTPVYVICVVTAEAEEGALSCGGDSVAGQQPFDSCTRYMLVNDGTSPCQDPDGDGLPSSFP